MTYYGGKELAASFRQVRKNTIAVAQDIPEEKYGHVPAEGARSVRAMLIHIAVAPRLFWQSVHESGVRDMSGFDFARVMRELEEEELRPRTKQEIVDLLASEGERFAAFLEPLTEADFADRVAAAGGSSKSRFEMLLGAKEHEMHHRGQLMLVERQLGIVPHITRQMTATIERLTKEKSAGTSA
jgi:uncharacterized damage-inducible protein DinB